jgi:succinate dehydrogenase / fumarate reductase cytochrome b subunit
MLSITHRMTGLFLSLGMVVFTYWLYQLATAPAAANGTIQFFQSTLGTVVLFAWVFAFAYHLCNGIRHLFWDAGKGYSIPAVYRSGYLVVISALVITAVIFFLSR